MTGAEVYRAMRLGKTVIYRNKRDGIEIAGHVAALRLRYENERDVFSAEIKTLSPSNSIIICRAEDVDYWEAITKRRTEDEKDV